MPFLRKYLLYSFSLVLLFSFQFSIAQNKVRDSLSKLFPTAHDTVKVKALISISRSVEANNPDSAVIFSDSALKLAKKARYQFGVAGSYGSLGSALTTSGKYDQAITNLLEGLKIFESLNNKRAITNIYNSIANAYMGLNDDKKAYEYFLNSYNMANQEPKNENMIAVASVGLGNMLLEQNKLKEAISYYLKAEKYFKEQGRKNYQAMATTMIGETYMRDLNYVEAEKYFLETIPIFKETNDDYGLGIALNNIASCETKKKNYKLATEYSQQALEINLKRNAYDNIQSTALNLGKLMELQNKPLDALKYYKTYMQFKDSVINIERTRSIVETESKYESEKKEQQLLVKNLELEKSNTQVKLRNTLIYFFIGTILLFCVLLIMVMKQNRDKKKANSLLAKQFEEILEKTSEIQNQKNIIEEKNKDITDSINYSKHIQQAILPSENLIKRALPNSYFIFKPKDIISGDFYFVENTADRIYFAVVDCTGHGVPGAMLSVFAQNTIKKIISQKKLMPNEILSEICKEFKTNLNSNNANNESINDGMDIALACIDKYTNKLYFSGAKNPLLMARNNELQELKADRWGISGKNEDKQLIFTNHEVDLQRGDKIYLFSDGIVDQFGGPQGKKFKYKQLQQLILDSSKLLLDEQKKHIETIFESWKGNQEQLDDVTLMCVSLQ